MQFPRQSASRNGLRWLRVCSTDASRRGDRIITFEYPEDEDFFNKLIGNIVLDKDIFNSLFDFRDPGLKRLEFNKNRELIKDKLIELFGIKCQLNLTDYCNIDKDLEIDHIIPLSTNVLNKTIRHIQPEKGKKVTSQSFGSNNLNNLVITCKKCNAFKKQRILTVDEYIKIFTIKRLLSVQG